MELLSTSEAAALLGLSRQRVLQFISAGRLPAQMVGRQYVIRRADLEAFASQPRPTGWPAGRSRKAAES